MTDQERKRENYSICLNFAVKDGIVSRHPDIDEIHLLDRMSSYIFDEDHEPFIYSWDDDWSFGSIPAQKMAETVIARMRVAGFLLKEWSRIDNTSIHIWNDGDSFVFVLAAPVDPEITDSWDSDEDYEALVAVAYTASTGDHADLINSSMHGKIDLKKFIEDGKELVGFPSYNRHDLDGFLSYVGMTHFFNKDGMFKPGPMGVPRESGSEVFEMTEEGFSIVRLLPW